MDSYDLQLNCVIMPIVFADVVAYVDVWSSDKRANYSKSVIQQLEEMGAQVKTLFLFVFRLYVQLKPNTCINFIQKRIFSLWHLISLHFLTL